MLDRALRLLAVCERHGAPLRAAALRFPFGHPAVASVLTGARTPDGGARHREQLRRPIPDALWDELRAEGLLTRHPRPAPTGSRADREKHAVEGAVMRVALHTKVRADRIEEYEAAHRGGARGAHRRDPRRGRHRLDDLAQRNADLFHVLEFEDYPAMIAELEQAPRQHRLAGPDGRAARRRRTTTPRRAPDAVLPVVWEL